MPHLILGRKAWSARAQWIDLLIRLVHIELVWLRVTIFGEMKNRTNYFKQKTTWFSQINEFEQCLSVNVCHPRICVFSCIYTTLLLLWPWPWPMTLIYELDPDVPTAPKMKFLCQVGFCNTWGWSISDVQFSEFTLSVVSVAEFSRCGKEMGLLLPFKCRKQNDAMKKCLTSWSVAASWELCEWCCWKTCSLECNNPVCRLWWQSRVLVSFDICPSVCLCVCVCTHKNWKTADRKLMSLGVCAVMNTRSD